MLRLSSPIYTLKRQAKKLARDSNIRLYQALDQIARTEGFKDWSHLASTHAQSTPAKDIVTQMKAGDVMLVGARPGHGKTLLGLELAALAGKIGRSGHVFTLDWNEMDVRDALEKLGFCPKGTNGTVAIDTSDDICADNIIARVPMPQNALIVVDYLQLLDQKRANPTLDVQLHALRSFATKEDAIVVLISQIDRAFDRASGGMPALEDIRLPNPVDLSLFDKRCFLHDGRITLEQAA